MNASQGIAVLLIVIAFLAGWTLRGLRMAGFEWARLRPRRPGVADLPAPDPGPEPSAPPVPEALEPPPVPTAAPERPPISTAVRAAGALERATSAYRAARASGAPAALTALDDAIEAAEPWADELAAEGDADLADAYDAGVNALVGLGRALAHAAPDEALAARQAELDAARRTVRAAAR